MRMNGVGIEDALQNGGRAEVLAAFQFSLNTYRPMRIRDRACDCDGVSCGFPAENAFRDQTRHERNTRNCGGTNVLRIGAFKNESVRAARLFQRILDD